MSQCEPLFKRRILDKALNAERDRGTTPPPVAMTRIRHWANQISHGVLSRMTESQAEQTFINEIFGTVLGYEQIGTATEASLMPKRPGSSGRDTPDFVLGRFDLAAGIEEWAAVGEIKNSKTDLDQPQVGRKNKETPVDQAFRYATKGRPGIDWIIVSNFREIRLYKNGYAAAYHGWRFDELLDEERLFEFYVLLRPEGVFDRGVRSFALRVFEDTIAAGRNLTEGFYSLYKAVQQDLIGTLSSQTASTGLTPLELYGKVHKLLNRVLFMAFCEQHPAGLLPRDTLRQVANRARNRTDEGRYWKEYIDLFHALNDGGGIGGIAYNAFNGGLFAPDPYYDSIVIPDALFTKRFQAGRGRRQSLEIVGIFGFDIYDFTEDLNVQALGAIFEQSLKDTIKGPARVRGFGEIDVSSQNAGGVYYTPGEITSYLVRRALHEAFEEVEQTARADAKDDLATTTIRRGRQISEARAEALVYDKVSERLRQRFKIIDPACGSGAFLVEAFHQLHARYDKINRTLAELLGSKNQMSMLDLDRQILRQNLHGRDLLPESVEISRLSIWLRTARKGEKLESLDAVISTADSLRTPDRLKYDIVVGNPPWGADLDGWTDDEIQRRFPNCGEEKDSYAIFVIRAWEMLKVNGILAFIVPNSWLTVKGYEAFRGWFLRHFDILEITNVWKIFSDVNHDATMLVARKRVTAVAATEFTCAASDRPLDVKAVGRGQSEADKLKQIAAANWTVSHTTSHGFHYKQPRHRFEVSFEPKIAEELDRIAARCDRLDQIADVTVGIQVYHHTMVPKEFIRQKGFHSTTKRGTDWYPYVESNDVQRYFHKLSTTQWLQFSEQLRDKRDLGHYREPRILVQQIFWKRLSTTLQKPSSPILYLNSLFSISNAHGIPLECVLGIINSKFVSASYERRANRLFGDKFPKVSKSDLATVPIPRMTAAAAKQIGQMASGLQAQWQALRSDLAAVEAALATMSQRASLDSLGEFWTMTEASFLAEASSRINSTSMTQVNLLKECYSKAKAAVDERWHEIMSSEDQLEDLVRRAYGITEKVYQDLSADVPGPSISWVVRR